MIAILKNLTLHQKSQQEEVLTNFLLFLYHEYSKYLIGM